MDPRGAWGWGTRPLALPSPLILIQAKVNFIKRGEVFFGEDGMKKVVRPPIVENVSKKFSGPLRD